AEKGYNTLYPLFKKDQAPAEAKQLVHTEIGYMDFEQKKQFYRSNPEFFTDSLSNDLNQHYRQNEGFEIGTTTSFSSDNYANERATVGLYTQWGDRTGTLYRFSIEEGTVSSDILNNHELNKLYHLKYRYQRSFSNQTSQFFVTGGAWFDKEKTRPDLGTGFWFAQDSSFTSLGLRFEPVFTNHSIQRNINQIRADLYREDYWLRKNGIQTTLALSGNWYTNKVFKYESALRLYFNMPFSTRFSRLRPLAALSWSDASKRHLSSIPYYTPHNYFVQGAGIDYSYKSQLYNPDFSTGLTFMARRNNRDGLFFSGSARLSARINNFWQISLQGELSTSDVYRYNNIGLNISYLLPKTFTK
ncbi:MAG TPA: hypothetical protein VK074_11015, partial [Fodinibius sp.]|nr:hypothetical protein [Fodinibius sp.]